MSALSGIWALLTRPDALGNLYGQFSWQFHKTVFLKDGLLLLDKSSTSFPLPARMFIQLLQKMNRNTTSLHGIHITDAVKTPCISRVALSTASETGVFNVQCGCTVLQAGVNVTKRGKLRVFETVKSATRCRLHRVFTAASEIYAVLRNCEENSRIDSPAVPKPAFLTRPDALKATTPTYRLN